MAQNQDNQDNQDKKDNNQHDTGYKLLFSHPELVRDLLTGFVKEEWVWEIDLNTLESVNTSFVTDDLRERHDDKIWRVRFREQWLYLYLLLEFQSSNDYFIAVRIMTYIGLLYQDIIRSHGLKKGDILPPVVPIVIYNWGIQIAILGLLTIWHSLSQGFIQCPYLLSIQNV